MIVRADRGFIFDKVEPDSSTRHFAEPNRILDTLDRNLEAIAKRNKSVCLMDLAQAYEKTHIGATFLEVERHCIRDIHDPPANGYSASLL